MEKEMIFHTLGIGETRDEETIREAYRNLLKKTNPEDDPEGFKRLREAYEAAITLAGRPETEEVEAEKSGIDLWLDRVEEVYQDVFRRVDEAEWEKLFSDPVCQELDTSMEARERMIAWLMRHVHLPFKIWRLIDRAFEITGDIEALSEQFPKDFLEYVKYYVEHEGFIKYELFEVRDPQNANADAYLDHYYAVKKKVDQEEYEDCEKELDDLEAFGLYYPYAEVERMRVYMGTGRVKEASELADRLKAQYPEDPYVLLYAGRAMYQAGQKDEGFSVWEDILMRDPGHYMAGFYSVTYLMEKENYYEARERMMNLIDRYDRDEAVTDLLKKANEALITGFREALELDQGAYGLSADETKIELGWCLFQNERIGEAISLLSGMEPEQEQEYSYVNLYGRVLYQNKQYGEALPHLERWLELIENTVDDGSAENKKRRSRRSRACHILGGCYYELGKKEKAKELVWKAIETADNVPDRLGCMQYLAHLLQNSGEYERAVDLCDSIIKEDERYYPAYLIRQEAFYGLRNAQAVVDDYHRAVELFAGYYKPYLLAAEVFFDYRQYEDAKNVIDLARGNNVEFSAKLKLYEVKILRNLAANRDDRKRPMEIITGLLEEIQGETDIEDKSEVEFETALLHWDNNDCDQALEHLTSAIRQNPDRMQYRMVRGHIYMDMKQYPEALKEYMTAKEAYADTPSLHYNMGLCYENQDLRRLAMECFEQALELEDGYRNVCEKLADYYVDEYEKRYERKYLKKAIAYMNRELAVTENGYDLVCRGNVYLKAMEIDRAMADYEKALEYDSTNWAAHYNLGTCYKYQGRFSEALSCFEKAAEYMGERKSLLPYKSMAACYEATEDYEMAIWCYRQNLKLAPDEGKYWREIADLYVDLGEFDKALEAIEHARDQSDYYKCMGYLWDRAGNRRKAVQWFKKGIQKASEGKKAERIKDLAEFYMENLMEFDKAITCYGKVIGMRKDPYDLFEDEMHLARIFYRVKKREKAKVHAQKALEHFAAADMGTEDDYLSYGDYRPARLAIFGWIYICLGQEEKGLGYLEQMDQCLPCRQCRSKGCFEKYWYEGWFYKAQGDYMTAYEKLKKADEYNPHVAALERELENIQKEMKGIL